MIKRVYINNYSVDHLIRDIYFKGERGVPYHWLNKCLNFQKKTFRMKVQIYILLS